MAAHLIGQQLAQQQIISPEDFLKILDRGTLIQSEIEKESLKRSLPPGFTHYDPITKRPLSSIPSLPQMQNNLLSPQQLLQQQATLHALQARNLSSSMPSSYLRHTLDPTSAVQLQQANSIIQAQLAESKQRQIQPQLLHNQNVPLHTYRSMTLQEYSALVRLLQQSIPQRRQSIGATNINQQMSRMHRISPSVAPQASSLGPPFSQQINNPLTPHITPSFAPTLVSQPTVFIPDPTLIGHGPDDPAFQAFLESVRQIEAHLTKTLAESIQRSSGNSQ